MGQKFNDAYLDPPGLGTARHQFHLPFVRMSLFPFGASRSTWRERQPATLKRLSTATVGTSYPTSFSLVRQPGLVHHPALGPLDGCERVVLYGHRMKYTAFAPPLVSRLRSMVRGYHQYLEEAQWLHTINNGNLTKEHI